jgi:hypothetical protein
MFNPVQQIMIGKTSGAASSTITTLVTDAASVVAGDLYIVNQNMKVIAAATDITPNIHVVQGTAAGKYKISPAIKVADILTIETQAYQAQAQKSVALGNIGSSTLDLAVLSGYTYKLSIVIRDDQRFMPQRQTRRDYAFTTSFAASTPTSGEKTAFIQKFVDAINKDAFLNTEVVAALNNTSGALGIQITGVAQVYNKFNNRPEYVDFQASFYDSTDSTSTYQATSTTTQAFQPGNGLGTQIASYERKLLSYDGYTNRIQFPVIPPTEFASTSTNYDTIAINYLTDSPGVLEGRDKKPKGVIIACATASTQMTAIQTALKLLNDSASGNISNNSTVVDADI